MLYEKINSWFSLSNISVITDLKHVGLVNTVLKWHIP
jgi:hypothetical protein